MKIINKKKSRMVPLKEVKSTGNLCFKTIKTDIDGDIYVIDLCFDSDELIVPENTELHIISGD